MMLAETMGIPVGDVNPQVVDTDTIGLTSGTGGSSVTFKLGWTVYEAGTQMINKMRGLLASEWEVSPEAVHYEQGTFSANENRLSFKEAGRATLAVGTAFDQCHQKSRRRGSRLCDPHCRCRG